MEPSGGPGPGPVPVPGNNKGRGGAAAPGRGRDLARPPRKDSEVSAAAGSGVAFPGGAGRAGPRLGPARGCQCPGAVPVSGRCRCPGVPVSGCSSPAWASPSLGPGGGQPVCWLRCSRAGPRAGPSVPLPWRSGPGLWGREASPCPAFSELGLPGPCLVSVGAGFPSIHPFPRSGPLWLGWGARVAPPVPNGSDRAVPGVSQPSRAFLGVAARYQRGVGWRVPLLCSDQGWLQQEVTNIPQDTPRSWGHPELWGS